MKISDIPFIPLTDDELRMHGETPALARKPEPDADMTPAYMKGYQDGQDAVAKAKKGQSDEDSR